jgi:hypothetical protein
MNNQERFEVLTSIESELGKRADAFGILSLSAAERTFLRSSWAKGALDCNGFAYFFSGPIDIREAALAFEEIGFAHAAVACMNAAALFPDGNPMNDMAERANWIAEQGESLLKQWENLCKPVWGITQDEFDEALTQFVRRHSAQFNAQTDIHSLL